MSCERFARALTDHACGAPLDDAAGRHLAACAECRDVLDEHRRMLEMAEHDLRRALDVNVSAGFAAEAVRRAHAAAKHSPVTYRWWMGAAAALLAVGVWVGVRALTPTPPPDDVPTRASAAAEGPARGSSASVPAAAPQGSVAVTTAPPVRDESSTRKRTVAEGRRASGPSRAAANTRPRESANPRAREPQVIVPPTQARAITRLRELLAARVLDGATLPPAVPLGGEPAPLTIAPLAVPEIAVPDVEIRNDSGGAGESGPREMELAQ